MDNIRDSRSVCFLIIACLFFLGGACLCFSQTADEYFEQGKADLTNGSLVEAHTNFQNALFAQSDHQGANFFYSLTTILMISVSTELNDLLDQAGVSATGRDIFNWNADFTRNAYGDIILPADTPTGGDLQNFAHNDFLPVIDDAIDYIDNVSSGFQTNFNWLFEIGEGNSPGNSTFTTHTNYWSTNEWIGFNLLVEGSEYEILSNTNNMLTVGASLPAGTYEYKIVAPIDVDYGDVLAIRGGMYLAKAAFQIFTAFDFNADIDAIVSLLDTDGFDVQTHIIQTYPQLLILLPTNQMTEAKANVRESITQLSAAINHIVAESDPQGNDFIVINAAEGAQFIAKLEEWDNALDGAVFINDLKTEVDLTQFFDYPKSLRDYLPRFNGILIVRGSISDPTIGGIFPTMTKTELYRLLDDMKMLTQGITMPWIPLLEPDE